MLDMPTWNAILQQWPWFAGAAAVFVVAIGSLIALKPPSKRQPETAAIDPDKTGWMLTERIDFADNRAVGELVLQVEENRSIIGWTGLEHREIRWRNATVEEAKKVLKSYNAQRNLAMTATLTVSGMERTGEGQGERLDDESRDAANAQDMANATLIPQDAQRWPPSVAAHMKRPCIL
jgi:hypothetical protein